MEIIGELWPAVLGWTVAAASAAAVLSAVLRRGREPLLPRRAWWIGLIMLVAAGDAAFGDHRPTSERLWKGFAVMCFCLVVAIELWRRRMRRRDRPQQPDDRPMRADA